MASAKYLSRMPIFIYILDLDVQPPIVLPISRSTRVDSSVVLYSAQGEYTRSVPTLARGNNVEMRTGFGAGSEMMDYVWIDRNITSHHSSC
jgi:hypothetical protein